VIIEIPKLITSISSLRIKNKAGGGLGQKARRREVGEEEEVLYIEEETRC
jgi:hypothetical protein